MQKEVADMLRGRILVGHALHNDLKVLLPPAATRMPSCWLAVCSARHRSGSFSVSEFVPLLGIL